MINLPNADIEFAAYKIQEIISALNPDDQQWICQHIEEILYD
jgi:hypothetical protein